MPKGLSARGQPAKHAPPSASAVQRLRKAVVCIDAIGFGPLSGK
jgi:hypothetical protein